MHLILASASPRRAELLQAAGYAFGVHPVDIDEAAKPDESPVEYVERLAIEKATRAMHELSRRESPAEAGLRVPGPAEAGLHVPGPAKAGLHVPGPAKAGLHAESRPDVASGFSRTADVMILGADTAVVIGNEILGKPHDAEDAARMLGRLSGRTHQVMTGVCLQTTVARASHVEISNVAFAPLTEDQIAWYVASGEGRDKAGGYAIQGLAARFIPRIEGSYSNVVGLPIAVIEELIGKVSRPRSLLASGE